MCQDDQADYEGEIVSVSKTADGMNADPAKSAS